MQIHDTPGLPYQAWHPILDLILDLMKQQQKAEQRLLLKVYKYTETRWKLDRTAWPLLKKPLFCFIHAVYEGAKVCSVCDIFVRSAQLPLGEKYGPPCLEWLKMRSWVELACNHTTETVRKTTRKNIIDKHTDARSVGPSVFWLEPHHLCRYLLCRKIVTLAFTARRSNSAHNLLRSKLNNYGGT